MVVHAVQRAVPRAVPPEHQNAFALSPQLAQVVGAHMLQALCCKARAPDGLRVQTGSYASHVYAEQERTVVIVSAMACERVECSSCMAPCAIALVLHPAQGGKPALETACLPAWHVIGTQEPTIASRFVPPQKVGHSSILT